MGMLELTLAVAATGGLIALGAAVAVLALRRQLGALRERVEQQQQEIHLLQRMWRLVQDEEKGSRDREEKLSERVALLSRQQEQLMLRDDDTGPYFRAIREAESGATAEELMERTGISRGEADLIVALHAGARRRA